MKHLIIILAILLLGIIALWMVDDSQWTTHPQPVTGSSYGPVGGY